MEKIYIPNGECIKNCARKQRREISIKRRSKKCSQVDKPSEYECLEIIKNMNQDLELYTLNIVI